MTDVDKLQSLKEIAALPFIIDMGVSERQLWEWSRKSDKNGFPEPHRILGRFKFYHVDEVEDWIILWQRATRNMGRGQELNGGKR